MQQFSKLHLAARAYAEAGFPVFPCRVNGKQPATENGFYAATTDLGQIDKWWKASDYNVGIRPDDCGLFIVDVDPGGDTASLRLPETYTVQTPRGGCHLYYEGSGKTTASKLAPHIDTRGVGGYVLVPPSVVDGKKYTLGKDLPYASLPEWVAKALETEEVAHKAATEETDIPANIERARKRLEHYVKTEDVAIEGIGGDDRTFRLCCEILDLGLSELAAHELIDTIWNPHCSPPWGHEELALKINNAATFRQNEVGAYAVQPAKEVFGDGKRFGVIEKLSRFHFKDEFELDDEPDPTWLIKELMTQRSSVMMYGESGSYKSFLLLDICLAIATGKMTFGSETKPGLVFYGALEGKAHLKKGRQAWRVVKGITGKIENFFVGRAPMIAIDGEAQEFVSEIEKRCNGKKPALIVIDTLSKAMAGMNENDASEANRYVTFIDSLIEHFGCTVISAHHCGNEKTRARGSSALFAGFDTVLRVKAHKASKAVQVWVEKQKDVEERTLPFSFEGTVTGPSLTFETITLEQYKLLAGEDNKLSPKIVGAALQVLNAFGEAAAVTTPVLATQVTPARENESVEDRAQSIARTARALNGLSKGMLEGYVTRKGKGLVWSLPAPEQS